MIHPALARMIVREHMYKPLTGKILILGRQPIGLTYEQCIELLSQEQYPIPDNILKNVKNKYDTQTRNGKGTNFISDEVFFRLLGIDSFHVMDVSAYENADILHNLNDPIPTSLENQFDFIIDGGTFDHLVDLRSVFANVVKMLKVGGRIFQWNAASNFTGGAYVSFGPDLFYDFYSLNKFADCKVYLAEEVNDVWDMYEFHGDKDYGRFLSNLPLLVIVLAEKGPDSTFNLLPIQSQYRDAHLKQIYKDNQKIIASSPRKSWAGSAHGDRVSKAVKAKSTENQVFNKVALIHQQGGLGLVYRKSLQKMGKSINKIEKQIKGQVDGFRYIGKI